MNASISINEKKSEDFHWQAFLLHLTEFELKSLPACLCKPVGISGQHLSFLENYISSYLLCFCRNPPKFWGEHWQSPDEHAK